MGLRTFKSVVVALTTLIALALATPLYAQSPEFSDFTSVTGLTFNGSASQNGTALQLTPGAGGQAGSAWYNSPQPVQNGFTSTFQFEFTNVDPGGSADGIAFVVQNSTSGLNALGGGGGSIGYSGIPNSLAIEFDTYQNSDIGDPNANHVAIQSCGQAANTSSHLATACGSTSANIGGVVSVASPIFADGTVHTVIITYTPPSSSCSSNCSGTLQVNLDNTDLFAGSGASVNLATLLALSNTGSAYVGFTGATGSNYEQQDILSWTWTPELQQTVTPAQPAVFSFQNNNYTYQAQLNSGQTPVSSQVLPVFMSQAQCNALVQANPAFHGAQCFVYKNALGTGSDSAVLFELTCPGSPSSPQCNPYDAELGSVFDYFLAENPGYSSVDPFPGWLKGGEGGPDPNHPCATPTGNNFLFQSNQIDYFLGDDAFSKGGSGSTGSCWVATYNQPDETLPAITITTPPNGASYIQNQAVTASYACSNPTSSQPHLPEASNPTGPYLTAASCTQGTGTQGACPSGSTGLTCTGTVDTSALGPHTFPVTAMDSGSNTNTLSTTYNVLGAPADLAIANLGPLTAKTGSKITYGIGVGDLGPNGASSVVITDQLASGTTFVSASGNREVCTLVKLKLSCTVTALTCTNSAGTVTCNVGTVTPLSLSSLNGATVQITVQLGSTLTAGKTIKNTATVSSSSADPNPGNNSASASTLVTH